MALVTLLSPCASQDEAAAKEQDPVGRAGWDNPLVNQPFGAMDNIQWAPDVDWSFADSPLTIVRWWTVGCPFCIDSLPDLVALQEQYEDRGLRLLPVFHPKGRNPTNEALRKYLADLGYQGALARDPDWVKLRDLMQRGKLDRATSVSFLVDQDGLVRWVHPGPRLHRHASQHAIANADFLELDSLVDDLLPAAQQANTEVKVLSFNIRYGTARDRTNAWNKRRDLTVETIRRFDPDLVGIQEAQWFQVKFLRDRLDGYAQISRSRSMDPSDERCAILYRESRFVPLAVGHFMLSNEPDRHSSQSWDAALPRIATWARFRDKQNGRVLVFANTHFDHRGNLARQESWSVLQQELVKHARGRPVVLAGDFNQDLSSLAAQPTAATSTARLGLQDTYTAAGNRKRHSGTFHGFKGIGQSWRIDGVFAHRGLTVLSATIDRWQENDRYPSDHFPVQAILRY